MVHLMIEFGGWRWTFCSAYARQRLCKGKVPITTSTVVEDRRSGIDPAVKGELRTSASTRQCPIPEIRSYLAPDDHEG